MRRTSERRDYGDAGDKKLQVLRSSLEGYRKTIQSEACRRERKINRYLNLRKRGGS
jgi:hypothetical protein